MSSVQDALKAREQRKKKEQEQFKASHQEKTNKVDSALKARENRIKSNMQIDLADLNDRINAEIETIKTISTPSWGDTRKALDSTRESRINVDNLIREVEAKRRYLGDEATDGVLSSLNTMKQTYNSLVNLSQFKSEEDYNNHRIGWLDSEAEVNADTVSARKEKYQSNKGRIAELEKMLPFFAGSSWIPNIIENAGFTSEDQKALRDELEALKVENTRYEREQKALDDYYTPVTDEFLANGAKRDYTNASREDLHTLNANEDYINSLLTSGSYKFDEYGNIVNVVTGGIQYKADDLSRAIYQTSQEGVGGLVGKWLGNDPVDYTGQYYNSLVQDKLGMFFASNEEERIEASSELSSGSGDLNNTWARVLTEGDANAWSELDEHEVNIYYNLLHTKGQEAAYKFLEDMTVELTRRATQRREDEISQAPLLEQIFLNVASIPMNVLGGGVAFVEDALNTIAGNGINPYSQGHSLLNDAQAIRKDTATDINNATGNFSIPWLDFSFGDVYQSVMSYGDQLLGLGLGANTYGVLMGMGGASSKMKELYEEGASAGQIVSVGLLTGAAEMIFEKVSIESLINIGDSKTKKDIIINLLKQGGIEASEEALTEIANTITDAMIMGSQSDLANMEKGEFLKNVINAGLGGFISGGLGGGIVSAANKLAYNSDMKQQGQNLIDNGSVDTLKALALEMSGVSKDVGKLSSKVASNPSAKNVGMLSDFMGDSVNAQNTSDIQNALVEKGLSKKDAKRVAENMTKAIRGEQLTEKELTEMKGNENIKAVAKELLENPSSAINERNRNLLSARLGIDTKNAKITASKSDKLSLKNDVNVKEKISESGKTTLDTGEEITIDNKNPIAKVEYVDGERVVYFNTNQGKVESSKVRYASENEGLLYEAFVDMNPAFANAVIKNYDNSVPIQTYINGMREGMILYGMHNFQAVGKDISKNSYLAELSEADQAFALNLGRQYAKADAKKAGTDLRRAIRNASERAKTSEGASSTESAQSKAKKGSVSFENNAKAGKQQRKIVALAKHLASAMGIDIVFYDGTIEGTYGSDANGYYDEATDTIHLDLQKATTDAKTIAFTLSHELMHFVEKWSPEKYNKFAEFLMEQYAEHGVSTSTLLKKKMAELGTNDADYAYREMIADACETMLLDSNAVVKLMELRKSDLDLFEKIKLHILKLLNSIREAYKKLGYQPTSDEAKALLSMKDVLERFYSMFEDAVVDATQTYQAAKELNTESVSVSEDGTIKLQMKQYQQTGRATLFNYLKEQYGNDDASDLILTIDNIYDTLKEVKKDEALSVFSNWQDTEIELDENGHPIFTTSINNGDYDLNQDFSRVCKKRRQLDFVLNMLAEDPAFEASHLTKQDFVKINKAIKEHGFEIACSLCFVDSKRFRQAEWADSFANTWNDILNAVVVDGSKLTPFNFATKNPNVADDGIEIDTSRPVMYRKWSDGKEDEKNRRNYDSFEQMLSKDGEGNWLEGNTNVRTIATLIRDNPELRHTFRGADIIASQGFDTIQRLAPRIRSILDGWGGSSVPKPSSNDASYDSSIINTSGYNKNTAYAMGGVRMNSFSDFMAHMFFDYCQAFADLSAKELPSQAYTKELIYVRLFGKSGQKINMSGIPAIRDDALPTSGKGITKAQAEANEEIEKMISGLDVSRLLEHLDKDIYQLTKEDVEQFLDMCDYVWADESINMKHATLLQTGILYDKLSESKIEECYELLKAGEIEQALKAAGKENVDTDYAKHCGTIVVGVSDAHIRKLLRDPTVRMVIPYHKSGLNPVIARELKISAYNDYTLTQTTGVMRKGANKSEKIGSKAIKDAYGLKDFAFYDWFGKTIDGKLYDGKATADKYLEWCENGYYDESVEDYVYYTTKGNGYILAKEFHKKAKIVPKFEDFSTEENYYKVLEDFDCYNTITSEHSAQEAVDLFHNGLPSDYKDVLVGALKEEQKVYDDFRDHLDNKGLRDEVMEIVKARGYVPSNMDIALDNIVEDIGSENIAEVTEQYTDVENTTQIKKQKKKTSDNTYESIGKELMYYEEGNLAPDLTLVETINDRTGKKEVTIKHHGQKPKNYIPKKIAYCYKLFEQHPDGTLHALFAGAKNAVPIGEWRYAQGFPRTDDGVSGMNLRERYGWHLSAGLPSAPHLMSSKYFERGYPSKGAYGHPKGSKRVWVRMAYDASTDFNSIADSTGANNDIYGLIPFGGYYAFKENNQSEWVISSAVKIDKILTEEERQQILKDAGYDEHEAWRRRYQRTPEERTADELASKERQKAKARAKKLGIDTELSANTKAMREAIKSRIIDNPELKNGIKFQKKGVNKNGIEVYETSEETMALSWKERISAFEYELNSQYVNKTARFVRNGHTYYAKLDEGFFDKVIYGESHFSKKGKKAFIRVGADGDVFDLIENSTYKRSGFDTKDHKKKDGFTDYFDYFFKTVQIDNKVYDICVNVKKQYGTKDGYTYTMFLVDNEKIKASPSISTKSAFKSEGNALTDDIIHQKNPNVKRQLKKDSLGNELSAEQQEFFKDSKVRDSKGDLKVVYHGTKANFNVFAKGDIGFHFGTKGAARGRVGNGKNAIIKEVYLNITNPISINKDLGSWNADTLAIELFNMKLLTKAEAESVLFTDDKLYRRSTDSANKKLREMLLQKGYDGIEYRNTFESKKDSTSYIAFNSNQVKEITNKTPSSNPDIRFQKKRNPSEYAPTFYSHMGKVVDGIKSEKVGAGGVVPYLKGKGVKHDEIKWSGIEAWLEGKKSVTKAELQEFIQGSQLQIEEEMSDALDIEIFSDDGDNYKVRNKATGEIIDEWEYSEDVEDGMEGYINQEGEIALTVGELEEKSFKEFSSTRWSKYRLDGGENYREFVFKMPNSSYSNQAMRTHWGEDAEGVLAHARIQDFDVDGKKMLFIEEIQSDWHNEGAKKGYEETEARIEELKAKADEAFFKLEDYSTELTGLAGEWETVASTPKGLKLYNEYIDANAAYKEARDSFGKTPDAPFRSNYHEYVLKRLIRMAAEEGYDSIGWTTAEIQSKRWSDKFAEGYRIEYDQDMPKFLNKYGKKWGASVEKSYKRVGMTLNEYYTLTEYIEDNERDIEQYRDELADDPTEDYADFIRGGIEDLTENTNALREKLRGTEIWSMDIPDSMKDSVLYEGQPKFQKKTPSNRTILANALDDATSNDIEKRWLKDYQSKIALIEKEEAHLAEVNSKIKEISFTKGSDRSQLKELNAEKARTASRINTYDKQLIRLEAMKPIKDILQREKELVRKRTEEKGREALDAYRERMTKTQRELLTRSQNMRRDAVAKVRETHDKNDAKKKLQKLVLDTAKWISYPKKDDAKCPDFLKAPYSEFLKSIDLSSKRSLEGGDATLNDIKVANAMNSLANAIEKIKMAQDPSITADNVLDSGYLDLPSDFVEKLRDMAEGVTKLMVDGDYVINKMSSAGIKQLSQLIRTLNHAIKEMSTLYSNLRFANVEALGYETMKFLDSMGELKSTNSLKEFMAWDNALPYYAFKRFGEAGESVFTELMDAQDKLANLASEIFAFKDKTWTDKEAKAWGEDVHTINLPSGNTLALTTADAMGIYCLSRREQARPHLLMGGVRVLGIKKGAKKLSDSHSSLTQEDLGAIISSLTDRQKNVAEAIQRYMSTVCSNWGNEISMKRFLTSEFTEEYYYPIESNDENLAVKDPKAQQSDLYRLLNISATKPLTPKANNEIIIRNIFDVFVEHASDMARLNAFGMPLLDYMKWINYHESILTGEDQRKDRSVRKSMRVAYEKKAEQYVIGLIKDINGRFNDNGDNKFLMNMMRMAKVASVGNNLRVVLLQITSYPRAAEVLSLGSLAKGLTKVPSIEKAKKYCGIALWKSFGFYDTNIARSIEEQVKGSTNIRQKLIELSMKGAEWADAITWGALWNACEYEVAKTTKNKVGSEEFYQEVGKKLREVVYATQVVDSVLTRSQIMRSKSGLTQGATSFMSEPTLSYNILADGVFQFEKEKRITGSAKTAWRKTRKAIGRKVAIYSSVAIVAALMEGLADAWRDDEDEEFGKKFGEHFGENLISDIIPFNKIPIFSDIVNFILSRFGVGFFSEGSLEMTWLGNINDALDAWADIINEKFNEEDTSTTIYSAIYKTTKALSSISGIAISGVMREVVALWNNTAGAYDSTLKIRGYELSNEKLGNSLFDAIVEGDTDQADSIKEEFDDEDSMESALRKTIRTKYEEGELTRDDAMKMLIEHIGMEQNDAYWKMKEWDYRIANGTDEGYSKYTNFYEAVRTGKNLKAVISEYTSHGVEEKTLASQITSYFKPLYIEMTNSERASIKGYLLNAYSQLGYDRNERSKSIDKWLEQD